MIRKTIQQKGGDIELTYRPDLVRKAIDSNWDSMRFMSGQVIISAKKGLWQIDLEVAGLRKLRHMETDEVLHGIYHYEEIEELFENQDLDSWVYDSENYFTFLVKREMVDSEEKSYMGVFFESPLENKPESLTELFQVMKENLEVMTLMAS